MIRDDIAGKNSALKCKVDAYQVMDEEGYCKLRSDDFILTSNQKNDLKIIQDHFDDLSLDPYSKNSGRYRQHSKYVLLPCYNLLIPQSSERAHCYKQDVRFNDEVISTPRKFQPVPKNILSNELILSLILHDFKNSPLRNYSSTVPMEVGIHFIRMEATNDQPGLSVPNRLHKDGEPCTWIHLIQRDGVYGGESVITDNTKNNILCNEAMADPLDSIGIVDELVWHQVKPVYIDGSRKFGFRDVILIDFTPMESVPNNPV